MRDEFLLFLQIFSWKVFSETHHQIFEEFTNRDCKNSGSAAVRFYLDVVQSEVFIRIFMDIHKVSYDEAEKIMSG